MRLLAFFASRLRPLRALPPLPHLLDALLWIHSWLFRHRAFAASEAVFAEALAWPGVSWTLHRFGGRELRLAGREIGHLHGNGVLDIPLASHAEAERARAEGLGREHHSLPRSRWVSRPLTSEADIAPAITLLRRAAATEP